MSDDYDIQAGGWIDITASGQALAWDVGRGELFTSQTARALKETLNAMMNEDAAQLLQRELATLAPKQPKWLEIQTATTTGNTIEWQQTAIAGTRNVVYQNGRWEFVDPTRMDLPAQPAPVAVAKVCTCGVKFTGGEHSDWCDLHG